jgi:transcriptional regulator with XRE-family HTH domain
MTALAGETLLLDLDAVREKRERLGLTMEQAAEAGDIGSDATRRQSWYMLESGRRSEVTLTMVTKMAKALKCRPTAILKEQK